MANKQFLSIQGCYLYDNTIFDNMVLPDGVLKERVIQDITMECSDLELIYPDVTVMKNLIEQWSIVELPIWQKYFNTQNTDYDPLNSINLKEDRKETRNLKSESTSTSNSNGTDTQKVSAYNDNNLVTRQVDNSDSTSNTNGVTDDTGTIDYTYHKHGYDNKWNMTESERLQKYIDFETKMNIYHFITDSFMKRFCLMIY